MIALIGEWVVRLTAAALLAALAAELMPQGPVSRVGRLACALMVLLVLLRPLSARSDGSLLDLPSAEVEDQLHARLDDQRKEVLRPLIEGELAAYISDKAAGQGIPCEVMVICGQDASGVWLPTGAEVRGELTQSERAALAELISRELGVAPENVMSPGGE